ncbi:MAG: class I SAM-dependent methyltransferase, partial [Candidatus Micrarchaeota archaeon]
MDTYAQMADMYDLIYAGDFDVDYYVREAKKTKGQVLEIGCGTGRVMLELLKQGVKVEGLDISADMLRILRNKAKALGLPAKVYKADMRKFDLKKKYS